MVFTSLEDLAARIDDPALDVTPDDFLVLQNAGPTSASAMPEAGYLPIPGKLARAGVKDMVRISDARMSGTAYGTIVLHVSPDAAIGGPLALVRNGDRIRLSVKERRLDLLVDPAELARRAAPVTTAPAARLCAALPRADPAGRARLRFRFPAQGAAEPVTHAPAAPSPRPSPARGEGAHRDFPSPLAGEGHPAGALRPPPKGSIATRSNGVPIA